MMTTGISALKQNLIKSLEIALFNDVKFRIQNGEKYLLNKMLM